MRSALRKLRPAKWHNQKMAMRVNILLVDDEADNRRVYGDLLEAEGYKVRRAISGDEAFSLAVESPPDLVLSDVSMQKGDGLSLLSRLRAEKKTGRIPVILMSGVRTDPDEQADGLEQGADDYLPKPVPPKLLRAKIAAVLRRFNAPEELGDVLKAHGAMIDVSARTATIAGKRIALTRKEFDLLTTFLRKPGRVLSIPFLLETVWGYDPADYSDPHTVGVHVSTLRKKIGTKLGDRIVALAGIGYRFEA
jgi:DNA-binding response OmpR family regulator